MVPLLLLVTSFAERPAMATSLAAIGLIALEGALFFTANGDVKFGAAALVGFPATVGVVAGTALQQRLATRTLSIAFSVLLTGIGVRLLV